MKEYWKERKVGGPSIEMGVVFAFGRCFEDFKFSSVGFYHKYPDARAYSRIFNRNILIEFEYKSSNFIRHKHDIDKVDLIICWRHDAYALVKPVLELRSGRGFIFDGQSTIRVVDWRNDDPKEIKRIILDGRLPSDDI